MQLRRKRRLRLSSRRTGSRWGAIRATVKDGRFVAANRSNSINIRQELISQIPITYTTRHVFVIRWYAWTGCVKRHLSNTSSAVISRLCASELG
ncbi:hypothetical protein ACLK1T_01220 [Escherichia coli]